MRKLIAWAFMYSLDGLLADEGTEYWQFCFGLPQDPAEQKQKENASPDALRVPAVGKPSVITIISSRSVVPRRNLPLRKSTPLTPTPFAPWQRSHCSA